MNKESAGGAAEESVLIKRILAGERELFHALIRPHEQMVYRMAFALVRDEAEAEDVVQSAMIQAFTKLSSFRAEARFSTWLVTIALNDARSRLRRQKGVREESVDALSDDMDGDFTPAVLTDWREIPSESLERAEVCAQLERAIGELPEHYREVLVLRDVEGLDTEETARALALTEVVVKVRLHRARRLMQQRLAPVLKDYAPRRRSWFGGWS